MSKTSVKQRYIQLKEWLPTLEAKTSKKTNNVSRLDHYKKNGVR